MRNVRRRLVSLHTDITNLWEILILATRCEPNRVPMKCRDLRIHLVNRSTVFIWNNNYAGRGYHGDEYQKPGGGYTIEFFFHYSWDEGRDTIAFVKGGNKGTVCTIIMTSRAALLHTAGEVDRSAIFGDELWKSWNIYSNWIIHNSSHLSFVCLRSLKIFLFRFAHAITNQSRIHKQQPTQWTIGSFGGGEEAVYLRGRDWDVENVNTETTIKALNLQFASLQTVVKN